MAVLKVCGFETESAIMTGEGITLGGSAAVSSAKCHQTPLGYGGTKSILVTNFGDSVTITTPGSAAADEIHTALYIAAGGSVYLYFTVDGGSVNAHIRWDADGYIRIYRGSFTLLATSATTFTNDAWHTFKVVASIRDSGRIRVFRDGSTSAMVDTGAAVDCRETATDDFANLVYVGQNSNDVYIDDFAHASSGLLPDEALYVKLIRPTADGSPVNSTPSTGSDRYATVDESTLSTADYNELAAAGDEDHLSFGNLGAVPNSIIAVKVHAHATGQGSVTQMRTLVESGATTAFDSNQGLSTGGTYSGIVDIYETDPDTASAWTQAGVDAAYFGYEAN